VNEKSSHKRQFGRGLALGFGAYLIWGSFPIIISLVAFANPAEVVVWRIVFGFALAVVLITITRGWPTVLQVIRTPKQLVWVLVSTVFIMANWQAYVIGVATHQVVETALGYFINPLVTIALAVIFLGERLRLTQWLAVGAGLAAVVVLTVDYGRLPVIALTLAFSFGIYGLAKSKLGGVVKPLHGFALESGFLLPVAAVELIWVATVGGGVQFGEHGIGSALVLAGFGFLTAVPLILFGSAARHLPLRVIGFMQYLTPTIQFILALLYFHEPMPAVRWVGFALVWSALAILSFDMVRQGRARSKG
jgi:chloramphenicol-sensitive protein RarD